MAFRRIDVDAFDDDRVEESDLYDAYPYSPQESASLAKRKERDIRALLQKGDYTSSLVTVLNEPPYGPEHADAKTTSLACILLILSQVRSTEIAKTIKTLSPEQQDTLMKYLYKGMSEPEDSSSGGAMYGAGAPVGNIIPGNSCAVLLSWHEKLTEIAGTGCIVRVMSDHRRV
ncbi:uncharacterized protein L969DRAFT_95648 [Mixia osmundae IAM 14324]|uniref:Actin-related protein 2/3 complex subunit 5 n=1 Tax=Mixia osmundae (strain CBS 9802 / IAM 14324 / JCM 22182 / KY 12970) TaxID=764103 RepID=G7E813_MIXOS|nr:uncharacterized protein L969DRAFT_95648 [Mixia osmundae IAM 14324]KEI38572.1 hypothetical protein L969DRAFT_95648 [Mixia osmundae IAM 14324]GAA98973.1 hypothetical protein E5Q_05661 [Mixia osmundae IAM 14324]